MSSIQRADINNLLSQMRELKAQASVTQSISPRSDVGGVQKPGMVEAGNRIPEFGDMFKSAINAVHETQQTSAALATAYEQGDPSVSLTQVMVASQKASVSFQALTQVRNKLVEAYQDVMNMPL